MLMTPGPLDSSRASSQEQGYGQKFFGKWPGGSCQMPWLAVIGTSRPAVQPPKPRLCSSETPGEVALSSSDR
jgi:hypothetical protein